MQQTSVQQTVKRATLFRKIFCIGCLLPFVLVFTQTLLANEALAVDAAPAVGAASTEKVDTQRAVVKSPAASDLPAASNLPAASTSAQRAAFIEAVKIAQQGKPEALSYAKDLLQDYILQADIRAIYLKATLDTQSNKAIEKFLQTYPMHATSNDLLRAWLDHLYQTRQWKSYLAHAPIPTEGGSSTERRCQHLQALVRRRQAVDLSVDALPLWMVGKSQPDECNALFDILKKRGVFTPERIMARIDLALERARFDLARHLSAQLPDTQQKAANARIALWRQMSINPQNQLKAALRWEDGALNQAIVSYGIRKLARLKIDEALNVWTHLDKKFAFSQVQQNEIENYLALRAAFQRHPKTQQAYLKTEASSLSVSEREWQIRHALWVQDWRRVLQGIDQSPEASRMSAQWQYWRARALAQLGQKAEAKLIYTQLAQKHGYFEFLAADQLKADYQFTHEAITPDESVLTRLGQRRDLQRARELLAVNMPGRSRSEWRSALNNMSADEKTQAGVLAQRWSLATSSIQTAVNSGARADIDILYPRAYEAHVVTNAKRFDIDPAWIFGVIRQESLFMPDVRSAANAYGLMQLLPATAKQTARKNKIIYRGFPQLVNPASNIELGSAYLAEVNKRLQSNPALASAAYNGGPHRVRKWLPQQDMPADIWVENIVFNETRKYVQRVLSNKVIYSWRLDGKPIRLDSFMKTVLPPESVRVAQN